MVQDGTGGWRHFFPGRTRARMSAAPGPDLLAARAALRRSVRALRRSLPPAARRAAAERAARRFATLHWLRPGLRIGAYLASAEEFDPAPLLELAVRRGARIYVPRLSAVHAAGMGFAPLAPPMRRNRFGLLEPAAPACCTARQLDLLLMPLVAFDARGARLGMGGGFYDRALAFRHRRPHWRGPRLVGVAFDVQAVAQVPIAPWDVRLDAVLTDNRLLICREEPT